MILSLTPFYIFIFISCFSRLIFSFSFLDGWMLTICLCKIQKINHKSRVEIAFMLAGPELCEIILVIHILLVVFILYFSTVLFYVAVFACCILLLDFVSFPRFAVNCLIFIFCPSSSLQNKMFKKLKSPVYGHSFLCFKCLISRHI